jgi:hypothetical protein
VIVTVLQEGLLFAGVVGLSLIGVIAVILYNRIDKSTPGRVRSRLPKRTNRGWIVVRATLESRRVRSLRVRLPRKRGLR